MPPRTILVMRHAERPDDPGDDDLSIAGKTRAKHLAEFIPATFGKPDAIFASAISPRSARPFETVLPLWRAIGVGIDASVADEDYGKLAKHLIERTRFDGKLVLVCWHHGKIPALMGALGAHSKDYPKPWDDSVFNLILRADFNGDERPHVTKVVEPF